MTAYELRPRCTIEIIDENGQAVMVEGEDGQMVPILDWGASIEPAGPLRARYREYWTEEEDLTYTYRPHAAEGSPVTELIGGIHGNIGYELIVREKQRKATLRVDYFAALPILVNGELSLDYEPKSVTVTCSLAKRRGPKFDVQVEWQPGLSVGPGQPFFKWLRVRCR
jgi:hypothetical protein